MIWMSGVDKLCTYFNQPWLDFTGRPVEAEIGNGWAERVHPEDLSQCLNTYTNAFDQRAPLTMEYRLRRRDGEYRWLFDSGVPRFNADGSFAGYIGSALDVTERKLVETALSTISQRLIEAQEEERAWIARELHDDISQRLASLNLNLSCFRTKAVTAEFRDGIGRAMQDASDIARDMRALSHRLHSSHLEILGLVAAASAYCRERSNQHKVEIDFHSEHIPRDLSYQVSLCLFRVLQEAVQNAIKHSGARDFEVSLRRGSDEIELTIRDWGVGFDTDQAGKGRGLGLTSMKERLKLVDGQLAIDSKLQRGTTIRARVPLSPQKKSASARG
jgi:PAS domain S-box-containing protein